MSALIELVKAIGLGGALALVGVVWLTRYYLPAREAEARAEREQRSADSRAFVAHLDRRDAVNADVAAKHEAAVQALAEKHDAAIEKVIEGCREERREILAAFRKENGS